LDIVSSADALYVTAEAHVDSNPGCWNCGTKWLRWLIAS